MSDKIKVMIIDDSALMRNIISKGLGKSSDIEVVGTALNGRFGLNKLNSLKPDIIILDLEMPQMNGLQFLEERNKLGIKTPVIILSSHAQKGAKITMEALSLGASEFILKPSEPGADISKTIKELTDIVLALGSPKSYVQTDIKEQRIDVKDLSFMNKDKKKLDVKEYLQPVKCVPHIKLVAIGISTGGPNALREVLPLFPVDFPAPVLIVQHMPAGFTNEFAKSLDRICPLSVKEAAENDLISAGRILIAPGDYHISISKKSLANVIHLEQSPPENGHRPSADVLFRSAAAVYGENVLGCIMTGMGKDGSEHLGDILRAGGITIAQDEDSSVVFGMPQVAIKKSHVQIVSPLDKIGERIITIVTERRV